MNYVNNFIAKEKSSKDRNNNAMKILLGSISVLLGMYYYQILTNGKIGCKNRKEKRDQSGCKMCTRIENNIRECPVERI